MIWKGKNASAAASPYANRIAKTELPAAGTCACPCDTAYNNGIKIKKSSDLEVTVPDSVVDRITSADFIAMVVLSVILGLIVFIALVLVRIRKYMLSTVPACVLLRPLSSFSFQAYLKFCRSPGNDLIKALASAMEQHDAPPPPMHMQIQKGNKGVSLTFRVLST